MNSTTQDQFDIKTDGNMIVDNQFLDSEETSFPGKALVAEYMNWYYDYIFEARGDKELDYSKFMEFSYELSEKAAPFL